MSILDMVPRTAKRRALARRAGDSGLFSLQREVNRLFDSAFSDMALSPMHFDTSDLTAEGFTPRVNVSESEKELSVVAELPGMDEKDVTVEVDKESITLRGERKEEREDKRANWHIMEHTYGTFLRVIPLPVEVKGDEAKAVFKKGVLTVTLPKRADAASTRKRIAIATS